MMGIEPMTFICNTNILPIKLHPLNIIFGRGGGRTHELKIAKA